MIYAALLHLPANSPDAQVFYQIANNSSSIAGSPLAHSPIPSGKLYYYNFFLKQNSEKLVIQGDSTYTH